MTTPLRVTAAAGLASALFLGSGLVAAVGDSVSADGNRVHSPERGEALEIASSDSLDPAGCTGWTTGATTPMTFDSAGTADGELGEDEPIVQWNNFCLRNTTTQTITVQPTFANTLSTDNGCGPNEASVDTDCTVGAPGELDGWPDGFGNTWDALDVTLHSTSGVLSESHFAGFENPAGSIPAPASFTIAPGDTRVVWFAFSWVGDVYFGNDESGWTASQSDSLQWDAVFTVI